MCATDPLKSATRPLLGALMLCLSLTGALAQPAADNPDWKESEAPPPPALDLQRLVPFDVSVNSALSYGIDPVSLNVGRDGVVRYVVVARSASGATNAMYEGIRCGSGEVKTYARHSSDGRWNVVSQPEWRSLFGYMPSHHARALAAQGLCSGNAPASSPDAILRDLKGQNKMPTR
jgi:hypothetical protein